MGLTKHAVHTQLVTSLATSRLSRLSALVVSSFINYNNIHDLEMPYVYEYRPTYRVTLASFSTRETINQVGTVWPKYRDGPDCP